MSVPLSSPNSSPSTSSVSLDPCSAAQINSRRFSLGEKIGLIFKDISNKLQQQNPTSSTKTTSTSTSPFSFFSPIKSKPAVSNQLWRISINDTMTLKQTIADMNFLCESYTSRCNHSYLVKFAPVENVDNTIKQEPFDYWRKRNIRVKCMKIQTETNLVIDIKLITIFNFESMVKRLHVQCGETIGRRSSRASDENNIEENEDEHICVICYENQSDLVLGCHHEFCSGCIELWNGDCPVCRKQINPSEEYIMTEGPSDENLAEFILELYEAV